MTAKRDPKRRVRQRQARTGESYVTARRRVMAARAAAGEPPDDDAKGDGEVEAASEIEPTDRVTEEAPTTRREPAPWEGSVEERAARPMGPTTAAALFEAVELSAARTLARAEGVAIAEQSGLDATTVVELREVTAEAKLLGFRCRITLFPSVLESAELANVLLGLRDALVGAGGSTGKARMFDVAFGLPSKPQPPLAVRPYPPTAATIFTVVGRAGPVEIACRLWYPASTLILRRADETGIEALAMIPGTLRLAEEARRAEQARGGGDAPEARLERVVLAQLARLSREHYPLLPPLYLVDGNRRVRVTHDPFVIGRDRKQADLVLRDGEVSRKHAAVMYRNGTYYMKDLGSTHGIRYKGMLIDNKRIDEGDAFEIGEHELRFTYIENG